MSATERKRAQAVGRGWGCGGAVVASKNETRSVPEPAMRTLQGRDDADGWGLSSVKMGSVKWQHERQAVNTVMRYISGVKGISNQIAINPNVTADAVQTEIESALIRQAHIDARNVLVSIQGNTVTLSGPVQSWAERQSAIYAAWNMPGVCSVVDHMALAF